MTPAVKILIITNVVVVRAEHDRRRRDDARLGLSPQAVFEQFALWQPFTYMFLHSTGGFGHILFNMLALWMFGTELERTWGTRFFTKYYFVTGIGAARHEPAAVDVLRRHLLLGHGRRVRRNLRTAARLRDVLPAPASILFIFPVPARISVMIVGAIAFLSSIGGPGGGVAHSAHLGGLVVGYLYLKGLRARPLDELKYRYLRWKMGRARSRFDVYSGGRSSDDDWKSDWKKHIH